MNKDNDPGSNFAAARQFVEFGLNEKVAGRRESASGPGSSQAAAAPALSSIEQWIGNYGVRSIVDLGCGDWNWMRNLDLLRDPNAPSYEGWDADPDLIKWLNAEYGAPNIRFYVKDICTEALPSADLFILRDVLFHLDPPLVKRIVGRIFDLGCLLATTSYNGYLQQYSPREALDINGWKFGLLNLNHAEFGIERHMIASVNEPLARRNGFDRFFNLYDFRQA